MQKVGLFTIKSENSGRYLTRERNGDVNADRKRHNEWEEFIIYNVGEGQIALRGHHGGWLCAEPSGRLVADRNHVGPWETFDVIIVDEPSSRRLLVHLQTCHGTYVRACPPDHSEPQVDHKADRASTWEVLELCRVSTKRQGHGAIVDTLASLAELISMGKPNVEIKF